jgi:hypothetical protein
MDSTPLVNDHLVEGEKLVRQLVEAGFEATTAFWMRPTEEHRWRFYIITPIVEREGLGPAYEKLHLTMRQIPQPPFWIDPFGIRLIGESDSMGQAVLDVHKRAQGRQVFPMPWRGRLLGDQIVDGVVLYPLVGSNSH